MPAIQFTRIMLSEISVRFVLYILYEWLGSLEPFIRIIKDEELWLYKYPVTLSYVPARLLWVLVFIVPSTIYLFVYMLNKNSIDLRETLLGATLTCGVAGVLIQYVKVIVGRPRPDFFYRCFPDGKGRDFRNCTGTRKFYMDGRKSFPSGHSGLAFASMFFLCLYISGKLKVYNEEGRGASWRFCLSLCPLVLALGVAISRSCDYHHHWQDILVGSILGTVIAYVCYRQYFPSIYSPYSNIPYALLSNSMIQEA